MTRANEHEARLGDPSDLPAYGIAEAARYLRMNPTTLSTWVRGRTYATRDGRQEWPRVIVTPDLNPVRLSFNNLVEAHVLSAIRGLHGVRFDRVRVALDYVRKELGRDHPLLQQEFETDGVDLFIRELGDVVNASQGGQLALRSVFASHLKRVERDASGLLRLYPFTRSVGTEPVLESPRAILISPIVAFGRPVLVGTGVRAEVIIGRFLAGESITELAEDLELDAGLIEEAVRWESLAA